MVRIAIILSLLATPAVARNPIADILCAPTKQMQDKLARQFRSEQIGAGVRGPDQIMEVWTDKRGDWALVVTYATGTSCIVAMGEHWVPTAPKEPA